MDIRAAMLAAARSGDPEFPDGRKLVLTHFSHVGQLATADGEIIYVADRRAVIAGMLSPRGHNYITFFDGQFRYLGKIRYVASRPLWCDGSRLYLYGELDWSVADLAGNVLDVAAGYERLTAFHMSAYGSSGGIEDAGVPGRY